MELYKALSSKYLTNITRQITLAVNSLRLNLSECTLCKNKSSNHSLLCLHCQNDLPLFLQQNLHGNLLNWPAIDKLFPRREFDQLLCLSPYSWPIDEWLKQFKYFHHFELAELFAFLLNNLWQLHSRENNDLALISVPLHIKKWQIRGYNQAHLIASAFAQKSGLPYLDTILMRTIHQDSQVGLSGKERRRSLKNAFELLDNHVPLPQNIILFDDVITTGTTANTICKLLKNKGVKHITVLTVALSLPHI